MESQLVKMKFLRLIKEIEEYNEKIEKLGLNGYGIDLKELKNIKNLPFVVELGKIIFSKLIGEGIWDTKGYKYHMHVNDVKECLDILEPLSKEMLRSSNKISFERLMNSISEGEGFIMEGIDTKKYLEITKNFPIVGTCYKWIHITENIVRKFIIKILNDKGLPSDASLFSSTLIKNVKSRKKREEQKQYIPKRNGGHDIFKMNVTGAIWAHVI